MPMLSGGSHDDDDDDEATYECRLFLGIFCLEFYMALVVMIIYFM